MAKPLQRTRLKNTRKEPCEICGANCNVYHRVSCKWGYVRRDTKKAKIKRMTVLEKIRVIINVIKS